MALKLEEIAMVVNENVKDPELKKSLLRDIEQLEADKKAAKEEENEDKPKSKNKHVIFIRGDENLKKLVQAGWLAKVSVNSDNNTLTSRIQTAAARQNDKGNKSKRGRKSKYGKIEKYADFFAGGVKREFTKQVDIQPIKELAEVIVLTSEEIKFD